MVATLRAAFSWECEECGHIQFIRAADGELEEDVAALIMEQFLTVDVVSRSEEAYAAPYLVTNVAIGPAFVQCDKCGKMHATRLAEEG